MGRIFSIDQMRDREIPSPVNFAMVMDRVRSTLGRSKYVVASQFCGSAAYGTQNPRSDVDFIFIFRPEGARRIKKIERDLYEFAREMFVPLELIPIDVRIARSQMHTISPSFMRHLTIVAQINGYTKSELVSMLRPHTATSAQDVLMYLSHKTSEHEKGVRRMVSRCDERYFGFLHGVLDDPIHAARKLLWHDGKCPTPDASQAVIRRYVTVYPRRLGKMLTKLVEADHRYRGFIANCLAEPEEEVRLAEYQKELGRIEALAPVALEFLKANALMLARRRR
jgi:predicted nucleotidyltransferase